MSDSRQTPTSGAITRSEILQQPSLWPTTLAIAGRFLARRTVPFSTPIIISGAGTSAYAASAIAASWPGALAIPSTDLLLDLPNTLENISCLISVARSGDSPETIALVHRFRKLRAGVSQIALTCNAAGALARAEALEAIVLDPRTNDRSLVMTSSFSNLALAGLCLRHAAALEPSLAGVCRQAERNLAFFENLAKEIAAQRPDRVTVLGSGPLFPAAREAALKILEMTAGKCVALAETYLGLRHGPMSFLRPELPVLCFLSSDSHRRRYEHDLLAELRRKHLGEIIAIGPEDSRPHADRLIPANAPDLPDQLRTPFEIVFPQLFAYHLSLAAGLDPDNPSPDRVITRVVEGVRIHDE